MTKLYATLLSFVPAKRDEEKGATAVEYGLLVALIAGAIIAAVTTFGTDLAALFDTVAGELAL